MAGFICNAIINTVCHGQKTLPRVEAAQARCINYRKFRYGFAYYERIKTLYEKFNMVVKTSKFSYVNLRKLGPVVAFSV